MFDSSLFSIANHFTKLLSYPSSLVKLVLVVVVGSGGNVMVVVLVVVVVTHVKFG